MTEIPSPQPEAGSLPDDGQAQQAYAWRAVCAALHDVMPGWLDRQAPAVELAVSAIRRLAAVQAPEGGPDLRKAFESWALHTPPDDRTNWEVFQAGARAALAAQRQAATLPTTLTDEMRAVLTNERCVYGSADELYAALLAAAPAPQAPVAWCELTASGQIAYFDGKPMVMPGPVGNDCHPHPLYLGHAPQTKERT